MSIAHLLNNTMEVHAVTDTQSPTSGGSVETVAKVKDAIPCTKERLSASERLHLGKEGVVVDHMFYCDPIVGVTLTAKHRIKCDGYWFDIQDVDDVQDRSHHMEIMAKLRG